MQITIQTPVQQNYQTVFKGFDKQLFEALKPPLIPLTVKRFDGSHVDGEVHVKVFGQEWISKITEVVKNEREIYFVDEGQTLPYPLVYWRHKHQIIAQKKGSLIVDEITYRSSSIWLDKLLYPSFYLQFYYRKGIYRRYFGVRT